MAKTQYYNLLLPKYWLVAMLVIPDFVWTKIKNKFWHIYHVLHLKMMEAELEDASSLQFNGRTYLSIQPGAKIKLAGDVVSNSGPKYAIDTVAASKLAVKENATFTVGEGSGWTNTCIHCWNSITIGKHVNIGAGCLIMDTNFHSTNWEDRGSRTDGKDAGNAKTAPVVIDDYAFIGTRSIICKGVRIGKRAMVAAGSVVIKDIPDDCIAGGNPCVVIKKMSLN